jgi:biotin carboxyl carrier protein
MKRIVVALPCIAALALAACRRDEPHEGGGGSGHEEEAAPFSVEHAPSGESMVVLSQEAREAAGIETASPKAATVAPEVAAIGVLLADPALGATLRAPLPGTIVAGKDGGWPAVGARVAAQAPIGMLAPRTPPLTTAEVADLASRLALARGEEKSLQAELDAANAALKRARELNQLDKGVSDQAVEAAVAAATGAEARLAAAKASAAIFEKAASAAGTVQLEPLPLLAPRDGEVTAVLAQPGENVEAGAALLRIADFRELLAEVRLPAGAAAPPAATKARVVVNGAGARAPVRSLDASVVGLAPEVGAVAPALRLRVSDPTGALRPGLGVTAYLAIGGEPASALAVPAAAVLRYAGRTWVYVEVEDGRFTRRAVTVARVEGDLALVTREAGAAGKAGAAAGLESGSKIVTTGATVLLSQEQIAAGGSEEE